MRKSALLLEASRIFRLRNEDGSDNGLQEMYEAVGNVSGL